MPQIYPSYWMIWTNLTLLVFLLSICLLNSKATNITQNNLKCNNHIEWQW